MFINNPDTPLNSSHVAFVCPEQLKPLSGFEGQSDYAGCWGCAVQIWIQCPGCWCMRCVAPTRHVPTHFASTACTVLHCTRLWWLEPIIGCMTNNQHGWVLIACWVVRWHLLTELDQSAGLSLESLWQPALVGCSSCAVTVLQGLAKPQQAVG